MAKWYYEQEGIVHGPVEEIALARLYGRGILNDHTPVWPVDGPDQRTVLGATDIELPKKSNPSAGTHGKDSAPSPLANAEKTIDQASSDADEAFFTSALVQSYIGKNSDFYLSKWKAMHASSGGKWDKTVSRLSWNWAAFFLTFMWLLYRKMWLIGGFVIVILTGSDFISAKVAYSLSFAVAFTTGIWGNALYLRQVRSYWIDHRDDLNSAPGTAGGTNVWAGVSGAFACLALGLVVSGLTGEIDFPFSNASCSSSTTRNTVTKIARENLTKLGFGQMGVDVSATRVSLNAVRTQSAGKKIGCAATIEYDVKLGKNAQPNADAGSLNNILKSDITYTVENTDDGQNIYVTVYGLVH